jgi:hypothetical protein
MIYVAAFHTSGSHGSTASIPSHHFLTTRHADSNCTLSDWSHPTQPAPQPLRRGSGKGLSTRIKASGNTPPSYYAEPASDYRHNRTASLSYRLLSIARKPAFFSRPVSSGILKLGERPVISFVCTTARPPLDKTRRLTLLEEWRCAVTLRR